MKFQLGRLVGLQDEQRVHFAQRSASLMKLAAQLQLARCRHVLTSDLSWPTYQEVLQKEARRQSVGVTRVPLRRLILHHRVPSETVIDRVCRTFVENRCDGLFLPLVSNLGIRLPVEDIVTRLRQEPSLQFVVVDGAQALGHVPIDLSSGMYDLFLAGCHKWLSAYNSLGIMFHGQSHLADEIDGEIQQRLRACRFDDPLARLSEELTRGTLSRFGETVNLLPLFTCGGALADVAAEPKPLADTLAQRIANRRSLPELAVSAGWKLVEPANDFQTGIGLLQPKATHLRCLSPHVLRERFHRTGFSVTAYARALVRISLPGRPWTNRELEQLGSALNRVHDHVRLRIEEISSPATDVAQKQKKFFVRPLGWCHSGAGPHPCCCSRGRPSLAIRFPRGSPWTRRERPMAGGHKFAGMNNEQPHDGDRRHDIINRKREGTLEGADHSQNRPGHREPVLA